MLVAKLSFDSDQFSRLFPYSFLTDQTLQILAKGNGLEQLFPGIADQNLMESFAVETPNGNSLDFASLVALGGKQVELHNRHAQNFILRGHFEHLADTHQILFVGSPGENTRHPYVENTAIADDLHLSGLHHQSLEGSVEEVPDTPASEKMENEFESRFRVALNKVGDNVWEHDFRTGKTIFSNRSHSLLGIEIHDDTPVEKIWWSSVCKDDIHLLTENDRKYQNGEIDHHSLEYRINHGDGSVRWVLDRGVVLEKDSLGRPLKIIGTHTDITNQKNAEQFLLESKLKLEKELDDARAYAQAHIRAKELFLANMSHEIRTPMNAIVGMCNQLDKTSLSSDQKFYLKTIHSAADNLLVVINDILDLSKIEAGELFLEQIGFEANQLIDRAMQVMKHKAEEKGLTFTRSYCNPGLAPVLIGDPYRLNQILLNLISNAIKFTEAGKVDLTCRVLRDTPTHQSIRVSVADTGIGMDEAFVRNLFQKFSQEDISVTRRFGGAGIGMSICKELVDMMNGTIDVQSKKGVGTVISFVIEFARGSTSDLPVRESKVVNTRILDNKKILVVDDNEMNRLVASTILKNYGATIREAGNGSIAISMLQHEHYDLVLMDVQMPVMGGVEATRIIRESISEQLPVIALTALAIKGDDTRLLSEGMNDYLSKPFEANQLLHVVSKWLLKESTTAASVKPATAPRKLYDLKKLTTIANGDEDFVQKMVALFVEQAQHSLTEMRRAFETRDMEVLQKTAHRLKPSIDTLDIYVLKEEIRLLEKAEENGLSHEEINARLIQVEQVLEEVVASLKAR